MREPAPREMLDKLLKHYGSYRKLAQAIGRYKYLNAATVCRIHCGDIKEPKITTFWAIRAVFNKHF